MALQVLPLGSLVNALRVDDLDRKILAGKYGIGDDNLNLLRQRELWVPTIIHSSEKLLQPLHRRQGRIIWIPSFTSVASQQVHAGKNLDGKFLSFRKSLGKFFGWVDTHFFSIFFLSLFCQPGHI